jgi:hypothetical protein
MSLAEPLYTDSPPRDGHYFMFGEPRDSAKRMGSRPKIPVRIWTVEERDEAGDLIDDVRQYIMAGDELVSLTQEEWLFLARRPISQEEYEALFITGDWK